jgi:hypothetical protein
MQCPGASELEEYLSGSASSPARSAIDQHLDGCADCRQTVALLAPALPRTSDGHGSDEPGARAAGPIEVSGTIAAAHPLLWDATTQGAAAPGGAGEGGESDGGDDMQGARVSRYILGERLGAGAMGVVYTAADPELHRNVAVKLMRGAWVRSGGDAARARVIREARALARISHPNVIAVYDVGLLGDEVFIAMELLRGANLRAHLRDARPSLAQILDVFTAAGQGLAAAHRAGVVHRDFKPDNVLVGEDGRVCVTDFGLALAAVSADLEDLSARGKSAGGPIDRTEAGVRVGTPAYMAPEQHAGAHVDPRSDQFSFCVALHEALYGERPFPGRTREELARSAQEGRIAPRPPESRVPGSLRAILVRGLAADPADRFPSMQALLRALGRDRGRAPRRAAAAAVIALAVVLVALGADWVVRGRAAAATRASFAAARAQTSRLFELRTETFAATADLSFVMPILREVAAVQDQADFGLGDEADDRSSLEELHHNLASADWVTWLRTAQGAEVAVADYKGRLLYASAAPQAWGQEVLVLAPVRAVYATGSDEVRIAVVRGDDPSVVAAGILGGKPRRGLRLLFTRLTVLEGRPRALFAQLVPGERLLGEIAPGEGTQVSMVAPDGTAQGNVPPAVVAAGLESREIREVEVAGEPWLVQRHPIESPGSSRPIAYFVLAHPAEIGLAGLFPGARLVLGVLGVALALGGLGATALVRARDLSRREPRAVRARA